MVSGVWRGGGVGGLIKPGCCCPFAEKAIENAGNPGHERRVGAHEQQDGAAWEGGTRASVWCGWAQLKAFLSRKLPQSFRVLHFCALNSGWVTPMGRPGEHNQRPGAWSPLRCMPGTRFWHDVRCGGLSAARTQHGWVVPALALSSGSPPYVLVRHVCVAVDGGETRERRRMRRDIGTCNVLFPLPPLPPDSYSFLAFQPLLLHLFVT